MKLSLSESRLLKDSVNVISELVNDVRFRFHPDKVELIAIDPANVAMIIFRLLSSAFSKYEIKNTKEIAVNLSNLKQVLKRAKPSDTVNIELDEEKNRLKIQLVGDSSRTFHLGLIDVDEKEQRIPELKFPAKIEMNTAIFDEAIEDMDVVSESVSFVAEPKKFTVEAAGNTSEGKVEFSDENTANVSVNSNSKIKSKYSIEYLKKIIKGSRLTDRVSISFDKDYPLKVEYTIKDKLQLTTILAPRVSEE